MNILLLNGLPYEYEGIPIFPDFRNMIQVDLIQHDPQYSQQERTWAALLQLYGELPADVGKAVEGLAWFFRCGKTASSGDDSKAKKAAKKSFCFEQDAGFIYSAFYATYGISLSTVEFLHWWEFMALFEGLPETTMIKRIMYWRTADTAKMPKTEKAHVLKMRARFALKDAEKEQMSVEELEQSAKDALARRYEEAQKWAAERAEKKKA